MDPPSLDPFPDLCLIAIFVHLPLSDLLAVVGLVCARWRALLPIVLARRRTLKITQTDLVVERFGPASQYGSELIYCVRREDGSPWAVRPKVDTRNVIVVPQTRKQRVLTEGSSYGLMNALENITNLTINQKVSDSLLPEVLTQIIRMLNHWQNSLLSLTLDISNDGQHFLTKRSLQPYAQNLIESFDRLRVLRHLTINFNFELHFEPGLQIFTQLVTLNFSSMWYSWVPALTVTTETIQQINTDERMCCENWAKVEPLLARKFGQIGDFDDNIDFGDFEIGRERNSLEFFRTFCSRFTALKHVSFKLKNFDLFAPVTRCLSQLSQLIHLEMKIYSGEPSNLLELTPLPSVRLLSLRVRTQSHHNMASIRPWEVFPNVQVLKMAHLSGVCRDCGYWDGQVDYDEMEEVCRRIEKCKRMARQALTRFPALHTIDLEQHPGTSGGTLTRLDSITSFEQL